MKTVLKDQDVTENGCFQSITSLTTYARACVCRFILSHCNNLLPELRSGILC